MLDDLVLSSASAAVIDAEMKNMRKSSWLCAACNRVLQHVLRNASGAMYAGVGQEQYSVLPWIVYMRCPFARKLSLLCSLFAFALPLRLVLSADEQSTIVIP